MTAIATAMPSRPEERSRRFGEQVAVVAAHTDTLDWADVAHADSGADSAAVTAVDPGTEPDAAVLRARRVVGLYGDPDVTWSIVLCLAVTHVFEPRAAEAAGAALTSLVADRTLTSAGRRPSPRSTTAEERDRGLQPLSRTGRTPTRSRCFGWLSRRDWTHAGPRRAPRRDGDGLASRGGRVGDQRTRPGVLGAGDQQGDEQPDGFLRRSVGTPRRARPAEPATTAGGLDDRTATARSPATSCSHGTVTLFGRPRPGSAAPRGRRGRRGRSGGTRSTRYRRNGGRRRDASSWRWVCPDGPVPRPRPRTAIPPTCDCRTDGVATNR